MSGNKLTKLDLSDCGRYWPNLETLYLGQNKLKEVGREGGGTLACCVVLLFVSDFGFVYMSLVTY